MKSALFTLALFATASFSAASAHATQAGDNAAYNITVQGQTYQAVNTVTNVSSAQATVQLTIGGTAVSNTQVNLSDLTKYQTVVETCAQQGGKAEPVTVPAGTFNSCHVSDSTQGEDIWFADEVTFGVVKITIHANGTDADQELTSYVNHP